LRRLSFFWQFVFSHSFQEFKFVFVSKFRRRSPKLIFISIFDYINRYLAAHYAQRYPQYCKQVALVNPRGLEETVPLLSCVIPHSRMHLWMQFVLRTPGLLSMLRSSYSSVVSILRCVDTNSVLTDDRLFDYLCYSSAHPSLQHNHAAWRHLMPIKFNVLNSITGDIFGNGNNKGKIVEGVCTKPLMEMFNQISSKITVICGDQDPLERRDVLKKVGVMLAQIGNGSLEILHGSGTAPHLEEPEQFCATLLRSLREDSS
jgi:pimeloyl-ACP methyl ester carboxylesterase